MEFRELKFDNQMCEGYQTHYTIDVIKEILAHVPCVQGAIG